MNWTIKNWKVKATGCVLKNAKIARNKEKWWSSVEIMIWFNFWICFPKVDIIDKFLSKFATSASITASRMGGGVRGLYSKKATDTTTHPEGMLTLRWSLLEWLIVYTYPSKTPQKAESSCCQGLVEVTFLVFQPPQHLRPICQICQMGSKRLKIKILLHKWVSGSSKKALKLKSSNKCKKTISKINFVFYYLRG